MRYLLCLAILLVCSETNAQSRDIVAHARNATVKITTYDRRGRLLGSGTGFSVSPDGWIITCHHVVRDAYSAKLEIDDKRHVSGIIRAIIADPGYDFAAFKSTNIFKAPFLPLDDSFPEPGTRVFAISSPLGVDDIYTSGAILKTVRDENNRIGLAITGISTQGSSGGPVLNMDGKVVGVIASGTAYKRFPRKSDRTYAVPARVIEEARKRFLRRKARR